MLKLQEERFGQTFRANDSAFDQHDGLTKLTSDITGLKQRIADQITLIQDLAWEAQDTAPAKAALHEMQEILRSWCAHRDLLVKLQSTERLASCR